MTAPFEDRPDREQLAERDRRAWNLPSPPLVPVGPASEVWPESPSEEDAADDERVEERDAAT
jgi:hypothetical protein